MSIDKLKNLGLDKLIPTMYDFGGMTEQETWCKFAQKINLIIEHFNYLDKKFDNQKELTEQKLTYLLGEGMTLEVSNKILELINNGTLKELINTELLGEINTKVDNFKTETELQLEEKMRYIKDIYLNVKMFGVKGDGITDDTEKLQELIDYAFNNNGGVIYLPKGVYLISKTLVLKPNVQLKGHGIGNYYSIGKDLRITTLYPTKSFIGSEIIRIDPKDINSALNTTYGVTIENIELDFNEISNNGINGIVIKSLSNAPTFNNIRVINNNNGSSLVIGKSENENSFTSDGLIFNNFVTLAKNNDVLTTIPNLLIESCNETTFNDCKFQHSSTINNENSVTCLIKPTFKVAGLTFNSCSFTGSEKGLAILPTETSSQGTRWVRVVNCTFENVKYGIYAKGSNSRPTQFCNFGFGNRFNTYSTAIIDTMIVLDEYASNNQIYADDVTKIKLLLNSRSNTVFGGVISENSGRENNIISNNLGKLSFNNNVEEWKSVTLNNNWNSNTSSRSLFGFRKDLNSKKVILRGYFTDGNFSSSTYVFTLGSDYAPKRNLQFTVSCGQNKTCIVLIMSVTGNVLFVGGTDSTDYVCLDGIEYYLD